MAGYGSRSRQPAARLTAMAWIKVPPEHHPIFRAAPAKAKPPAKEAGGKKRATRK